MTIAPGAVDAPVLASKLNQVYAHINLSAGRFVFTSNGTFVVPAGVHQFRVYMAGRGGNGGPLNVSESGDTPTGPGGSSPMISAIFTGQAIGASFAVIVGDGTNDGTTKFATLMQVTAGANRESVGGGGWGTPTFPLGQTPVYHDNGMFGSMQEDPTGLTVFRGFGSGGTGAYIGTSGAVSAQAGMTGVCVIEW